MARSEFELIARYFGPTAIHPEVVLGIGDDAALVSAGPGVLVDVAGWVASGDAAAEQPAALLGQRTLAGALARMATRGAQPVAFTLALTLPAVDDAWLAVFSAGLGRLAARHGIALIGGDTTRGPLAFTLHLQGRLVADDAVAPRGTRPGEALYLVAPGSGGAEADGGEPIAEPPPGLGPVLAGLATAATTLDAGLEAAIGDLVEGGGARIHLERVARAAPSPVWSDWARLRHAPMPTGVVFSVSPTREGELAARLRAAGIAAAPIGVAEPEPGLRLRPTAPGAR